MAVSSQLMLDVAATSLGLTAGKSTSDLPMWYLCRGELALPPLSGRVPKVSIPRGPDRDLITFYNLILEVTWCHFFQRHKPTQLLVKET